MTERPKRLTPDRRGQPRGGRRPTDRGGYAPMIVVIDDDARRRDISEAILAKLRFAVAPFASAEQAISAMRSLLPQAVVAREDVAAAIRGHLPNDQRGRAIPLLPVTDDLAEPEALVEALRRLLRLNAALD